MAADKNVIRNIEIFGAGPVVLNGAADIHQPGTLQREAAGPRNSLDAQQKSNIGIAECDALKVVVTGTHEIKESLAAIAIENHFAIAGGFNRNGLFRRAALRKVVSAVKQVAHGEITGAGLSVHVMEPVADVKTGMDEDHVARLHARRESVLVVKMRQSGVVSRHEAGEGGLLLRASPVDRVDVVDFAALRGLGFSARTHSDNLFPATADAIGIGQQEPAFIPSIRVQIENAAHKHVGRGVLKKRVAGGRAFHASGTGCDSHLFRLRPHQRKSLAPGLFALATVSNVNMSIAIGVTCDLPFKSEGDQGRRLDDKRAGSYRRYWRLRVQLRKGRQQAGGDQAA